MDPEVTALPTGDAAAAGEQSTPDAATAQSTEHEQPGAESAKPEGEEGGEKDPPKKEKSAEQREIERLRRRVDNKTRREYELKAELDRIRSGAPAQHSQQQQPPASAEEPVTLSRAELQKLIEEQAQQLAPSITEQQAEVDRRNGVVSKLAKAWGQEEFDAKASELDDVFGGLADRSGKPKPATDAIFDADDPKAVIEYLTDPDNADEADRIARLPATLAGRAIAKLEAKLEAKAKESKPKPSSAARPIEAVKGGGVPSGMPNPNDTKAYIAWANAQERAAR